MLLGGRAEWNNHHRVVGKRAFRLLPAQKLQFIPAFHGS
jgi:hypothetical protein